ncbi:hypothetical protein GBF38_018458 [Nibea albiflora]|uniref:Uncharacterized protein n=1 Tax=Nibea albiflora TaxID=240163 RepID=A0ACB7ENF8_NIBAL|nr:hypothetical protein GBF38_018458 [Nibea albiflora]
MFFPCLCDSPPVCNCDDNLSALQDEPATLFCFSPLSDNTGEDRQERGRSFESGLGCCRKDLAFDTWGRILHQLSYRSDLSNEPSVFECHARSEFSYMFEKGLVRRVVPYLDILHRPLRPLE